MKKLKIGCIVFILFACHTYADTWYLHSSCAFPGCANLRASSLSDWCKAFAAGQLAEYKKKNPNAVFYLSGMQMNVVGQENWPTPYSTGVCFFNGNPNNWRGAKTDWGGCPAGQVFDAEVQACVDKDKKRCRVSNPVEVATGVKYQDEIDAVFDNVYIHRYYRSKNNLVSNVNDNAKYGGYWNIIYSDKLTFDVMYMASYAYNKYLVTITDPSGASLFFVKNTSNVWVNRNGLRYFLDLISDPNGDYWLLVDDKNVSKKFNLSGQLIEVLDVNGVGKLNIIYRNEILNNITYQVADFYKNNTKIFSYRYLDNKVIAILKSNGDQLVGYSYSQSANLVSVTGASGTKNYHYENTVFLKALTGITDERGVRYATWVYDAQGRVVSSEHAGGMDKSLLTYNVDGSVTVTNPLNKQTIYRFANIAGARRIAKVEGQPTDSCAGANQDYTYTAEGWVSSKTDWKGIKTTFTYNAQGQEISRTEAFGTPEARTTTTEWHPTLYVQTKVTEPEKETLYSYDANGRLTSQTVNPLVAQ